MSPWALVLGKPKPSGGGPACAQGQCEDLEGRVYVCVQCETLERCVAGCNMVKWAVLRDHCVLGAEWLREAVRTARRFNHSEEARGGQGGEGTLMLGVCIGAESLVPGHPHVSLSP